MPACLLVYSCISDVLQQSACRASAYRHFMFPILRSAVEPGKPSRLPHKSCSLGPSSTMPVPCRHTVELDCSYKVLPVLALRPASRKLLVSCYGSQTAGIVAQVPSGWVQVEVPEELQQQLKSAMQGAAIPIPDSADRWSLALEALKVMLQPCILARAVRCCSNIPTNSALAVLDFAISSQLETAWPICCEPVSHASDVHQQQQQPHPCHHYHQTLHSSDLHVCLRIGRASGRPSSTRGPACPCGRLGWTLLICAWQC